MPNVQHWHDWGQVNGGWKCLTAPCTAFFPSNTVAANNNAKTSNTGASHTDALNHAWKQAGN
jgi:hypothetical protein